MKSQFINKYKIEDLLDEESDYNSDREQEPI